MIDDQAIGGGSRGCARRSKPAITYQITTLHVDAVKKSSFSVINTILNVLKVECHVNTFRDNSPNQNKIYQIYQNMINYRQNQKEL